MSLLCLALSPSCSGDEGERKGSDWRSSLEAIDEADKQLFSFSFVDMPSEGTIFTVAVLDPEHVRGLSNANGATCELFDDTIKKPSKPNFWYLKLALSGTTPGTYTIVPEIDENASSQASVRLVQVTDWSAKEDAFDAVGGTIELQEAPDGIDAWSGGQPLLAKVNAHFPENPLRRLNCRSEGPTDGSQIFRECTCEDLQGNQETCIPESGQDDCCYNIDGPTFSYQLEVVATPCAAMCRASSRQLYRYCEELR